MNWTPLVGVRYSRFIHDQPLEARESITRSSLKILSRCRNPKLVVPQKSHLIVGEVQSGKTMSFTGVTALARDNGYSLIIVVGGNKETLLQQTIHRLNKDLHISGDGGANPWVLIKAKELKDNLELINQTLDEWNNLNLPDEFKKTVIIATLKTKQSLDKLTKGVQALSRHDMSDRAVLIIDDEADQAGLNIAEVDGDESSVYGAIGRLRLALPNNDYLMYTATPQATLLLRIQDHLSPETVTVLESGEMYVGGKELFGDENSFVKRIPAPDVAQATNPQQLLGPPRSLKTALSYFLVGLAVAQRRGNPMPCSMLIHPGTTKVLHSQHKTWVNEILRAWKVLLGDQSDSAFDECMEIEFKEALEWISQAVDLEGVWPLTPGIDRNREILQYVSHWIAQIQIRVVNSAKDAKGISSVEWKAAAGWIVIGGAKLERGFTIENLTVTFMPRGTGVGNADSIQQRGRFFGYKRNYFDLLKGWLAGDLIDAFSVYVEHEESMRTELSALDAQSQPVSTWRRKFLLDPTLSPTRKQVIKLLIKHDKLVSGFVFRQHHLFAASLLNGAEEYRLTLEALMKGASRHTKDTRTVLDEGMHVTKLVPASKAIELLADIPANASDREQLDSKIFALQNLVDEFGEFDCEIVFMSMLNSRKRSTSPGQSAQFDLEELTIENLMAGRTNAYIGDEKLVSDDLVTIQFHSVIPTHNGKLGVEVIAAAIHWSPKFRSGVVWELAGQRNQR